MGIVGTIDYYKRYIKYTYFYNINKYFRHAAIGDRFIIIHYGWVSKNCL